MIYDLPTAVKIDGEEFHIRNDCDYRVVLDCIEALNDKDLTQKEAIQCALFMFYENSYLIKDINTAIMEMFRIINNGEIEQGEQAQASGSNLPLMDWKHDFKLIAPAVSRILGYDIRTQGKYTHWWTFLGAYQEIGDCTFSFVMSIRNKLRKGKKLEEYEREFYRDNKKIVDLPINLSDEQENWLNGTD